MVFMMFIKFFLLSIVCSVALFANEMSAESIIKKVDENMRGKSIYMKMKMSIIASGHTRTMVMQSWSQGNKKSFVKTLYPPKDKGITFLSLDGQMWQYVPKIERTIKIPPSMMLQNWMGSDITNDDLVKQSSIVEDYDAKILQRDGTIVTIELIPKEDAAVVWGKIVSQIDTKTFTGVQDLFYDEEGKEVRVFKYADVKRFGDYFIPTKWSILPIDKVGNSTQITLEEVSYDIEISSEYFQKSALKRFSR
ncbi:MAG: outer membrane lipoprotein-sorting protein [Campylobacterales bacterium]|nr:outer membrane lipoprotein-sorting protein [Campylobacterales bacterium]